MSAPQGTGEVAVPERTVARTPPRRLCDPRDAGRVRETPVALCHG